MKIKIFTVCILYIALTFAGYKSDREKDPLRSEYLKLASVDYSSRGSSEIRSLVDNYVENFKNKNFRVTSSILYTLCNDSALPSSRENKQKCVDIYSHIPIYDCIVKDMALRSNKNDKAQVAIQISLGGNIDAKRGITTFCLNPVLKDSKRYLTLLDGCIEGIESVYDRYKGSQQPVAVGVTPGQLRNTAMCEGSIKAKTGYAAA